MSDQPGVRFALADASQVNALGRPDHLVESSSGGTRLSLLGPKAKSDKMEHFLDLADSSTRPSPNSEEMQARLERKRSEYEKQREKQKLAFEAQMKALQAQQEAEEAELLGATPTASDSTPLFVKASMATSMSAPASPPPPGSSSGSSLEDYYREASASERDGMLSNGKTSRFARSKSGNDLFAFGRGKDGSSSGSSSPVQEVSASASSSSFGSTAVPSAMTMSEIIGGTTANGARKALPKSLPGSRRQSKNEEDNRSMAHAFSKLAMTDRDGRRAASDAPLLTSFLFDDDLDSDLHTSMGGPWNDDDKFPILVRRDSFPGILSASSAALDLAPLSHASPKANYRQNDNSLASRGSEWPSFESSADHVRQAQGLPPAHSSALQLQSPQQFRSPSVSKSNHVPSSPVHNLGTGSGRSSPVVGFGSPGKRAVGLGMSSTAPNSPQDARFGNKRSSLVMPSTASLSSPFATDLSTAFASPGFSPYQAPNSAMTGNHQSEHGLHAAHLEPQQARMSMYQSQSNQNRGYSGMPKNANQASVGRRMDDDVNRFAGLRLEDLQGDMASLCRDQHGCRFLQRKLEEGNPDYRDMIFSEIYPHFAELMTDSFGNYLAQRLLEFSTDEQKNILIDSIHNDLVNISLNIHGTRAIQRLVDHLTTPRQIQSLVNALHPHVVLLIKDLNGNHVVQKCLNSLKPEENQFIYNAVAENCVEVATHRHGCCVLQRCLDHATEAQRVQLVTEITYQCLTLVQDPFSNYVVQYCLEFDRRFVGAIIRQFQGNVCALSCHKFSSNVIEKCLRVAEPDGKRLLISEMLERGRLERLVKDNFANYVVQTACDFAEPVQREQLVSQIRPLLPMIRNTPYGKRIAARIQRGPQPQGPGRFVPYHSMAGPFAYGPPNGAMPYGHAQHHIQDGFLPPQQRSFSLGTPAQLSNSAGAFLPFAPQEYSAQQSPNTGFGPTFM